MKIIEQIKAPIYNEMEVFEEKFSSSLKSKVSLLNRINHFIVRRKGKQIRPILILLIAKILGTINEKTYRAASAIELLHTATLVHDDIVDNSFQRRNFLSINALWKNKIAVLVGDFLYSKVLLLTVNNNDFDLLKTISDAIKEMSEGELLQIEKARNLDIKEEVYYKIIEQKTAALISACCVVAAQSVNASDKEIDKIRQFGILIGIAFQIKDDIFDYTKDKIGKPTGIDIKDRKITLPLIYTLNKVGEKEKRSIINIIKNSNKKRKNINKIIEIVKKEGGLNYAIYKMKKLQKESLEILYSLPKNTARDSLELLTNHIINRDI